MKKVYAILILCFVGILVYIFGGYAFTHYRVFKPYLDKDFQRSILKDTYGASISDHFFDVSINDKSYFLIGYRYSLGDNKFDYKVSVWNDDDDFFMTSEYDGNNSEAKFNIKKDIPEKTEIITSDEFFARFYSLNLDIDSAKLSVKTRTFSNKTKDNETHAIFTFPNDYVATLSLPVFNVSLELSKIYISMILDTDYSIEEIKSNATRQVYFIYGYSNENRVVIMAF